MVWDRDRPDDFTRFEPADILPFLDWFEGQYAEAVSLGVADAFVEGLTQPYLEAIAAGQPLPQWLETALRWRLVAQWAYQRGYPITGRLERNMVALFPPELIGEIANQFRITPGDVANLPPALREGFLQGASFSLGWVKSLGDDSRELVRDLLAVQAAQNRNPRDAVPLLEQILQRKLVAAGLGISSEAVTQEQISQWAQGASLKVINGLATRARAIAQTESMRMLNMGILTSLEQDGHRLAYVMPHSNSCPHCRRLIDGRVFPISVLKENLFRNFGVKPPFWVASLPQHPFCRHSAMAPPVRFRDALDGFLVPPQGIVLQWFGLPGGESAMASLNLEKPPEGWLSPEGSLS